MANFPKPYVNEVQLDDPIMKRVPLDGGGIGNDSSSKPKSITSGSMTIKHTGGSLGKSE